MSTCGSCPLYWAEAHDVPLGKACSGNKSREICAGRLIDYINDLKVTLHEKEETLAAANWHWFEIERGVWMSQYDSKRGVIWGIICVQVSQNDDPRRHTEYEVVFMRVTDSGPRIPDIWQDKILAQFCRSLEEAKSWVCKNHEKYLN